MGQWMFKTAKPSESGNIAISLFIVVSAVTTLGIYHQNSSNLKAINAAGLSRVQADAFQANLSSLVVAQTLFHFQGEGQNPTVFLDPYLNPGSTSNRTFTVTSNSASNWQIAGRNQRDFRLAVRNPILSNLSEENWNNIASGQLGSLGTRETNVQITQINISPTNPHFIESVDVEARTVGDRRVAPYELRARLNLDPPPTPQCQFTSNAASRSSMTQPVQVNLLCNQVITAANIQQLQPIANTINLDVSGFARLDNSQRNLYSMTLTNPGNYAFQSHVFGVVGSTTNLMNFQITAPPPPPPPPPTTVAANNNSSNGSQTNNPSSSQTNNSNTSSANQNSNPPPSAPAPTCRGVALYGYCYFFGASGASCNATCSRNGLSFHSQGSNHSANSSRCRAILNAFNAPGSGFQPVNIHPSMGCKYHTGAIGRGRYVGTSSTATGTYSGSRRVCACR